MNRADFLISIKFTDGTKVELGGDSEVFVNKEDDDGKPVEGQAELNDDRLRLIDLVREAEVNATKEA